jgi:hypothetical protein
MDDPGVARGTSVDHAFPVNLRKVTNYWVIKPILLLKCPSFGKSRNRTHKLSGRRPMVATTRNVNIRELF